MNIFEKYGGYEAVKQAAVNYKNSGDRVTAAGLELQCLEYRRKHNIFEEGDKVVMINKRRSPKLWTWIHTTNWRPNHSLLNSGESYLSPFSNDEFRHAEPEELEAGKRLPD